MHDAIALALQDVHLIYPIMLYNIFRHIKQMDNEDPETVLFN